MGQAVRGSWVRLPMVVITSYSIHYTKLYDPLATFSAFPRPVPMATLVGRGPLAGYDVVLGRLLGRQIPADSDLFAGRVRQIVRPTGEGTAKCRELSH